MSGCISELDIQNARRHRWTLELLEKLITQVQLDARHIVVVKAINQRIVPLPPEILPIETRLHENHFQLPNKRRWVRSSKGQCFHRWYW